MVETKKLATISWEYWTLYKGTTKATLFYLANKTETFMWIEFKISVLCITVLARKILRCSLTTLSLTFFLLFKNLSTFWKKKKYNIVTIIFILFIYFVCWMRQIFFFIYVISRKKIIYIYRKMWNWLRNLLYRPTYPHWWRIQQVFH